MRLIFPNRSRLSSSQKLLVKYQAGVNGSLRHQARKSILYISLIFSRIETIVMK